MVPPRTRTRRTTTGVVSALAEAAEQQDTGAKTKVIIPPGTKTVVRETPLGREFEYEAELTQDEETEIEDEGLFTDDETNYSDQSQTDYQNLPKDPLTVLFDGIREGQRSPDETFVANISRQPDFMNDNFYNPCNVMSSFPPLQFNSKDMFAIVSMIQKHNNNSGGRFTLSVYRQDATPLCVPRRASDGYIEQRQVGLSMLVVPNPTKEILAAENGSGNNGIAQVLAEMHKQNMESNNRILEAMRAEKPKSTLEQAIEQKVLNDILNPPQPQQSNGNLEQTMATMLMMPAMVEGFARKMFPEPVAPHEPTTMDTVKEVLSLPLVDNAIGGILALVEQAQIAKMKKVSPNGMNNLYNPTDEGQEEYYDEPEPVRLSQADTDMQDLISDVVNELTGENPLNTENGMIKDLVVKYPDQFNQLKEACSIMTFEQIRSLLMSRTAKLQPNPFTPFIDWNKTAETNIYTWNESGDKLQVRLEELYNYLKSLS